MVSVGVGSKGVIPTSVGDLDAALEMGMDWSVREGYAWAEDKEHCEEYGRMLQADPSKVRFVHSIPNTVIRQESNPKSPNTFRM